MSDNEQLPPAGDSATRPMTPRATGVGAHASGYSFGSAAVSPAGAAAGEAGHTSPTLPLGDLAPAPVQGKERRRNGAGTVVGLLVAAALVGGGAGLGGYYAGSQLWPSEAVEPSSGNQTVTVNNPDSVGATTAIAAKVVPSVVTLSVSGGGSGGSGSGVVLSSDGYVVTNTHVVTLDGATPNPSIRVTTFDGRLYDAEVVGLDPIYDLAVIKLIGAEGLTPIDFVSSDELNVGDQAVAIGAPLGLSNTVTTGIVSALNRSIQVASAAVPDPGGQDSGEGEQREGQEGPFQFDIPGRESSRPAAQETISIAVIQTDAAINPGNSGGALVDSRGALIGINVAIASAGGSSAGGSIGVGFAIPSDVVKRVTDEIIAGGSASHGLLGATVRPAGTIEGATVAGAYIEDAPEGGAAAAAGLRRGDVVTELDGVPIADAIDLTAQVRAHAAGSSVPLRYVRDGQEQRADVVLGALGG